MSDDIRQGFIRQRRNLILVSLVVLFLEFAGVELKELNLFGNKLELKNPFIVNVSFWIALAYWFLRYLQHYNDLPVNDFHTSFIDKMQKYVKNAALNKYLSSIDDNVQRKHRQTYFERSERYVWAVGLDFDIINSEKSATSYESHRQIIEGLDLRICKIKSWMHVVFFNEKLH